MFDISEIRPKSLLSPVKAWKFLCCQLYDFLWLYYHEYSLFMYDLISFGLYHAVEVEVIISIIATTGNAFSRKSATTLKPLV